MANPADPSGSVAPSAQDVIPPSAQDVIPPSAQDVIPPSAQGAIAPSVLDAIVQSALDGVVLVDAGSYRLLFANAAFRRMLGYSPAQIGALRVKDLHPAQDVDEVLREFDRHGGGRSCTFRVRRHDGSVFFADIALVSLEAEQGRYVAAFFRDTTARSRSTPRTRLPAPADVLTGLANRGEFVRILELELDRARRYGTPVGLVKFELDAFKRLHDEFGEQTADLVLQGVGGIMKKNIRSTDVAARWSQAAFTVMTTHSNLYAATRVAEKLRAAIARHSFDQVGTITVCAGVTQYLPGETSSALLERVENALRQARAGGGDRVKAIE